MRPKDAKNDPEILEEIENIPSSPLNVKLGVTGILADKGPLVSLREVGSEEHENDASKVYHSANPPEPTPPVLPSY